MPTLEGEAEGSFLQDDLMRMKELRQQGFS